MKNSVTLHPGKGKKAIKINDQCKKIGNEKSKGLLGLHALTGADWGGKFSGITKKRWISHYLKLNNASIISALQDLGKVGVDIDNFCKPIERFICQVYSNHDNCDSVKELRWVLFKQKNLEAEHLPPTLGALKPHLQRAHLMACVSKGYCNLKPRIPPLVGNGWELSMDGHLKPVMKLLLPAPKAIIELVKCGCHGDCSSNRCSCKNEGLPCTSLCKCYDCANIFDYRSTEEPEDPA